MIGDTPPVSKQACVNLLFIAVLCVCGRLSIIYWSGVVEVTTSRYRKPGELPVLCEVAEKMSRTAVER